MTPTKHEPASNTNPPAWLVTEIAHGFQRLLVLGLDRAPACDVLEMTVATWADRLRRRNWTAHDAPRLREAFGVLCETCRQWPQIADLLDAMPPPVEPPVAARVWTDEDLARNQQRLAALLDQLAADLTPN